MANTVKFIKLPIKKVLLYTLLVAVVTFLVIIIVNSYDPKHIYSKSDFETVDQLIPSGDYQKYLKKKVSNVDDETRLENIKLEDYVLNKPQIEPIKIDLSKGIVSDDAIGFIYMGNEETSSVVLPDGTKRTGFYTSNDGSVTFPINNIPETGFYNIYLTYFPEKTRNEVGDIQETSGGANIERKVLINGELPFESASNFTFYRIWKDKAEIIKDLNGNDMKPAQVEIFELTSEYLQDSTGYIVQPYMFYLNKGSNTITLESVRENMTIVEMGVASVQETQTYAEYLNSHSDKTIVKDQLIRIEGEASTRRSSPTLYAISDRTSPKNNPTDPVKVTLNSIGGTKWTSPGDWIAWEVDAPEAGMYKISFKSKQTSARGLFSTRKVYVNGVVPFLEANAARFNYSSDWRVVTLGTSEDAFLFYLDKGINEIKLESTLGAYGEPINIVQNVTNELNAMYLKIIAITTVNPDPYQEYHLYGENARIEGLLETFDKNAKILRNVSKELTQLAGEKSDLNAILDKLAIQLESFVAKPRTIQERLKTFTQNISSLGTWISDIKEQSLTVEALFVSSVDAKLPNANANFFQDTWFQIRAFVLSFFFDYESIGVSKDSGSGKKIEVWFLTSLTNGREQANALKTLADNTFTEQTGIDVALKVVSPAVLLPSTLAGRGPDVAINVDNGLPVNYALRSALYDISQFDDFNTVASENGVKLYINGEETPRFADSAMVPYELNGGYYALPNTQSFLVMFYRTDIFEQNGWLVPKTWREVTNLVTELQISNLQFYLPLNASGATSIINSVYASMLFQRGGSFYNENKTASNLSSDEAMVAFEQWAKYYTDYGFPLSASFVNRFRTGETPIGIASYDVFNTLVVFAPEITGKWAFAPLPGTPQNDGSINNKGAASGTAVVMLDKGENQDKESSWEFMKWWTSAPTQRSYATELESILGAAARHNTANLEAFQSLSWTRAERTVLMSQWLNTVGVPEVAGGYYTGRNIENAFRKVVNEDLNAREVFEEYIELINNEITKKRKEFGMPTA